MLKKTLFQEVAFRCRNIWFREMFSTISRYCQGSVLDVGGRDFYHIVREKGFRHDSWVTVEYSEEHVIKVDDPKYAAVLADGCQLCFKDHTFDTVLNIEVLEHVFEPIKMFQEIARVLKPGGHAIFLVPQTGDIHELPHHYYNFTKFWLSRAAASSHLEIVLWKPTGGVFSSMLFHMVFFFNQVFRVKGYTAPEYKRSSLFFFLFPLMVVYAFIHIPVCMLFSLGDVQEGSNKNLMVVRKPQQKG